MTQQPEREVDTQPGIPSDGHRSDRQARADRELERRRRARLAAIFGDVLPDQTTDDADERRPGAESAGDEWLRRQVPPHHG